MQIKNTLNELVIISLNLMCRREKTEDYFAFQVTNYLSCKSRIPQVSLPSKIVNKPVFKTAALYLALPNPHHLPTFFRQNLADQSVALLVAGAFGVPIRFILGGFGVAAVVTVPETTVGENGDALFGKDEIRFAGEGVVAPPAFYAVGFEELDQFQLRGAVAPGFHLAHDLAALFGSESI